MVLANICLIMFLVSLLCLYIYILYFILCLFYKQFVNRYRLDKRKLLMKLYGHKDDKDAY